MGSTKEGGKGKKKGEKDGIHLVLQPDDEPNKTDNRTTGHETNLNTSNQTALRSPTPTRRKAIIFYKYKSKPAFELQRNISNSQESEKEAPKQG